MKANTDRIAVRAFTWRLWRGKWIILASMIVCLAAAALYLKVTNPVFLVSASMALNQQEDEKGGISGQLGALISSFSMGGFGSKMTEDEMYRLTSTSMLTDVARRTGIYTQYRANPGLLKRTTHFYRNSPIEVSLPAAVLDTISCYTSFHIRGNDASGWDITCKQNRKRLAKRHVAKLPCTYKTPYGTFTISYPRPMKGNDRFNFYADICSPRSAALSLRDQLDIASPSKKSNIIWIGLEGDNVAECTAVIDTLIDVYNSRSTGISHSRAREQLDFIDRRIDNLYSSLMETEQEIADYKREHHVVAPEMEAEYLYKRKADAASASLKANADLMVAEIVADFLRDPANSYSPVPFAGEISGESLKTYNELVLQRMRIASGAKENNATLKTLTAQVDAMRSTVLQSLESQIKAAGTVLRHAGDAASEASGRISEAPGIEKSLRELYRTQAVKNHVYAFLLEQREQAEMKRLNNTVPAEIIDRAYPEEEPVKPKKLLILGVALVVSWIIAWTIIATEGILRRRVSR